MESNKYSYKIEEARITEASIEKLTVCWIIPKFLALLQTKTMDREYLTHKNTVVELLNSNFRLRISFLGRKNDLEIDYMPPIDTFFVNKSLKIDTPYSENSITHNSYPHTVLGNKWHHFGLIDNITVIQKYCRGSNCDITFIFDFEIARIPVDCHKSTLQLSDDFKNLLTEATYSDVTMKSAAGVEFRVHKNIIAIRSKVLRAHFEHNTNESITNIVETTWETEVLRGVLTFVYTDKAPQVDDFPEKLLAAADYYQLEGLKTICGEVLSKRLTVENAIDTLQLAELHLSDSLRESTLEFIKQGRFGVITETQGWKDIQCVKLVKKIIEFIVADEIHNFDILTSALNELSSSSTEN